MTLARPTPEWMARAACAGIEPETFFPDDRQPADDARAVCSLCPVRAECLEYAIENDVRFGVWGGLTPAQRGRHDRHLCRRCGGPTASYRHRYCATCKAIVRAENLARYGHPVTAS